jgi:hypothetical protein
MGEEEQAAEQDAGPRPDDGGRPGDTEQPEPGPSRQGIRGRHQDDAAGKRLGKHYAGPTWESLDGSTVVGEVKARDPGPDPQAIPWLLLTAKSTTGTGVFAQTKSIQRVQTAGGAAPSQPCSVANATQLARVPYTAKYYFYR